MIRPLRALIFYNRLAGSLVRQRVITAVGWHFFDTRLAESIVRQRITASVNGQFFETNPD